MEKYKSVKFQWPGAADCGFCAELGAELICASLYAIVFRNHAVLPQANGGLRWNPNQF